MLDTRVTGRAPEFSGEDAGWDEWSFRFTTWCGLLGVGEAGDRIVSRLEAIELKPESCPDMASCGTDAQKAARALYNVMAQVCRGKALAIVRRTERGHGYLAWANLVREYMPDVAGRHTAILMAILSPEWGEERSFMEHLRDWERKIGEYEQQTSDVVSGRLRVATVMKFAPASVRAILHQQAYIIGADYGKLVSLIESFVQATKTYSTVGLPTPTPGGQPSREQAR